MHCKKLFLIVTVFLNYPFIAFTAEIRLQKVHGSIVASTQLPSPLARIIVEYSQGFAPKRKLPSVHYLNPAFDPNIDREEASNRRTLHYDGACVTTLSDGSLVWATSTNKSSALQNPTRITILDATTRQPRIQNYQNMPITSVIGLPHNEFAIGWLGGISIYGKNDGSVRNRLPGTCVTSLALANEKQLVANDNHGYSFIVGFTKVTKGHGHTGFPTLESDKYILYVVAVPESRLAALGFDSTRDKQGPSQATLELFDIRDPAESQVIASKQVPWDFKFGTEIHCSALAYTAIGIALARKAGADIYGTKKLDLVQTVRLTSDDGLNEPSPVCWLSAPTKNTLLIGQRDEAVTEFEVDVDEEEKPAPAKSDCSLM